MAETLKAGREVINGSVHVPRLIDNIVLGADTAESYTVPADCNYVVISGTGGFWMRVGATAAVPSSDTTDGTGSFYVPSGIEAIVEQGVALSFIRPAGTATTISIGRYS